MSTTVPASEVEKDFAVYHDRALTEPVRVTREGRETVYIVSAEMFRRLGLAGEGRVWDAASMATEEFTVQQAADILAVSKTYLARVVAEGGLASHGGGSRERIRANDLADYRSRSDADRHAAIREMVALSQELDLE